MSRKLLTFLLSELVTVRVICKAPGCGVVSEMSVDRFAEKMRTGYCPACNNQLVTFYSDGNALIFLAKSLKELTGPDAKVDIEFVLPDDSE